MLDASGSLRRKSIAANRAGIRVLVARGDGDSDGDGADGADAVAAGRPSGWCDLRYPPQL